MSTVVPSRPAVRRTGSLTRLLHMRGAVVGLALAGLIVALAIVGPYLTSQPPERIAGAPFAAATAEHPLGLDFNGRDVLSRVLHGGRSLIAYALAATLLAYAFGVAIGLIAGYVRSIADPILMRIVDVMLAFPALLFLLVLLTGTGSGPIPLVIGVALIQAPPIARIIRAATLDVSVRPYIEAAVARGERADWILRREILPNIASTILADAGVRMTASIILTASVSFLGLGLQPPAADWALMVSENRTGLTIQAWSVAVPAVLIAAATTATNLIADGVARTMGMSDASQVAGRP